MEFKSYSSPVFILRKEKTINEDVRYFSFAQKFGKIILLAKGAKKIKAKLPGHLEPPSLVNALFVAGKNYRLISALEKENYSLIKKDEKALLVSFKIFSLLEELVLFREPDRKIWRLLYNTFFLLEKNLHNFPEISDFIFLFFNAQLLTILGFAPDFVSCQICQSKNQICYFRVHERGLICQKEKKNEDVFLNPNNLRHLRILFADNLSLEKIANKLFIRAALKEKNTLEKVVFEFTKFIKSTIM